MSDPTTAGSSLAGFPAHSGDGSIPWSECGGESLAPEAFQVHSSLHLPAFPVVQGKVNSIAARLHTCSGAGTGQDPPVLTAQGVMTSPGVLPLTGKRVLSVRLLGPTAGDPFSRVTKLNHLEGCTKAGVEPQLRGRGHTQVRSSETRTSIYGRIFFPECVKREMGSVLQGPLGFGSLIPTVIT